ncbi:MAG: TIGR03067 domain-containing protein [Planctomycetes bacterium]|nr:TIGR03067 domain-containing protein [Planctomycetota bacterium]
MRAFGAVVMVLVAAFTTARADDDAAKKELKALQGKWVVVAAEHDGDALDRIVGGVMVIKDNHFDIKTKGGTELKGDVTLNPTKAPKHWDYFH